MKATPFQTRPPKLKPEINVTPLVDVVLVLLIIFMVIAPQLEAGERVELPTVQNIAKSSQQNTLTVTVTASGRYLLDKDVVQESELLPKLTKAHEDGPDKRVLLKADRGVKYGTMRKVFGVTQSIGFRGVALVVDEKAGAKASETEEPASWE